MSIFIRPVSPPPRAPSPELFVAPLPHPRTPRQRTHSALTPSPINTNARRSAQVHDHRRRRLSVGIPSPVPSPTPTFVASVSLPTQPYVYDGPKHIICSNTVSLAKPTHRPDPANSTPVIRKARSLARLTEKQSSVGNACFKFFGFKTYRRDAETGIVSAPTVVT